MAENVRDVIRAAQAAELGGDKPRAIELLRLAADLCRRSGNKPRAEQLLRYALRLDPSRKELEEELRVLEREEPPPPPPAPEDDDSGPAPGVFVLEEDTSSSLQEALREAELSMDRRTRPVALAVEVMRSAVSSVPVPGKEETVPAPAPVPNPLPEGEGAFIERGPTRADPTLDAWCSFCCRPRSEVGALVAGPAGAFICSGCIGESGALLGGVAPAARVKAPAPQRPVSVELVGQAQAREALEHGLEAGVRHVLLLGPQGSGKSTWMRALVEQGRGVLVTPDSFDRAPVDSVLLVEDVDRIPPAEQASLSAFLARHPASTVVMTARGGPVGSGLALVSDSGRVSVPTTPALFEAVAGSLPLDLLEQVQLLVTLTAPTVEDLIEIARRQLASRGDLQLSNEVLTALATEAARSSRSGHELRALLARVPPGSWRLEVKKKGKAKPARRGRRKGTS
ncbi:MAG TPA: ClpX C4-type zinc finger protein [Archangium sp.]|uniref:ClpX C4-type zinc finger protein n=1 Tax=Archangium sp. TaxID=1872627 RepID=UPI002E3497DF|nr:ClpX C4-type zinc finger protein [Archangium sp.]HEX5750324.1 ClpX C4-type zinc finger protein [Archangium sp.]